jgi:hypothetical protein
MKERSLLRAFVTAAAFILVAARVAGAQRATLALATRAYVAIDTPIVALTRA